LHDKLEGVDGSYHFDATVRSELGRMRLVVVVEAKRHKDPIKRELVQRALRQGSKRRSPQGGVGSRRRWWQVVDLEAVLHLPPVLEAIAIADVPLVARIGATGLDQLAAWGEWIAQLEAELLKGTVLRAVPHTNLRKVRGHPSSIGRAADAGNERWPG
jgi:hypothetical protein